MKLARIYRDREVHDEALAQYAIAAESSSPDVAGKARQARDELARWLANRPHDGAAFAVALQEEGFGDGVWVARSEGGGTQNVSDDVLVLEAPAGDQKRTARRETARPVRNLGFGCSVQFRASAAVLESAGTSRLGQSDGR